jgi:hypothetical protein
MIEEMFILINILIIALFVIALVFRSSLLRILIAIAMLTLIAYLASERQITKVYYNSQLNIFASYSYDQPFYPLIPIVYAILTIIVFARVIK